MTTARCLMLTPTVPRLQLSVVLQILPPLFAFLSIPPRHFDLDFVSAEWLKSNIEIGMGGIPAVTLLRPSLHIIFNACVWPSLSVGLALILRRSQNAASRRHIGR